MGNNRNYNVSVANYSTSQRVNVMKGCNGFTAVNLGDTTVFINDIPLFPSLTPATAIGDFVSIGGNEGEEYKGNIKISFRVPLNAAPQVQIIQKFYVEGYS